MKKSLNEILDMIKGSIIVSCQALPSEPMYCEEMSLMPFFARAAQQAGSKVIRTSSVRDVIAIKEKTGMPVIGLIKRNYEGFESYITPTMREIDELVEADSDVIALDCTYMKRGDCKTINQLADISTFEEGINAWKCGVDIVGTTMNGYTPHSVKTEGPNYELVQQLVEALPIPVIAEGRVHYPDQAKKMLELGAHAVVVGGAITRPLEIAQRFYKAIEG